MATPQNILAEAYQKASSHNDQTFVNNRRIRQQIEYVCRNLQNRAGSRVLLACALAKIHDPHLDIRKPYTEIGDADTYSGRTYDETFITQFINKYDLPCNPTTAFLTPALRNRNVVLTPDLDLVGRPPELYQALLQLLDDVYRKRVSAQALLHETIRWLIVIRNENRQRLNSLLISLKSSASPLPLSSEAIVELIERHLHLPGTSRLPVLIVAAAYQTAERYLGEQILPLQAHNAADEQTQAVGDVEIVLRGNNDVITCYEMKSKAVSQSDVDRAVQKLAQAEGKVDHYIFITTEPIDEDVLFYCVNLYKLTGTEFVILDCLGFLRHFLHLFHRLRADFLETYQALVLNEPDNAVNQPLKEAFLSLRKAIEFNE